MGYALNLFNESLFWIRLYCKRGRGFMNLMQINIKLINITWKWYFAYLNWYLVFQEVLFYQYSFLYIGSSSYKYMMFIYSLLFFPSYDQIPVEKEIDCRPSLVYQRDRVEIHLMSCFYGMRRIQTKSMPP